MSIPVIAFFNNKGGVGKTTLVYHLAWMMAEKGITVVAADLDPQANLTAAFLDENELEKLFPDDGAALTIYGALRPLIRGVGDVDTPYVVKVADRLNLLAGDLELSTFEDELSSVWPDCLAGKERAFRVISAYWRLIQAAGEQTGASVALMDLGPSLGATNRTALVGSDAVVVPLSPDLYSLQGLKNLGPRLREWRQEWRDRLERKPLGVPEMPRGAMRPIGYVLQQHSVRLDRPVHAYEKWIERVPQAYEKYVMEGQQAMGDSQLALLKHYRSLMPLAQEARKPMFLLRPADGAIGSHYQAAQGVYRDFEALARKILERIGMSQELWSDSGILEAPLR